MERLYIEYDMARFTRKDFTLVDVELYDGRRLENLEPRRLFPLSGTQKYITLLDVEGFEQAVIRDLSTLPDSERAIIEDCLREYYLIPRISQIYECKERFGMVVLEVETDRGPAHIGIRNIIYGMKIIHGSRVLLRDANDNRYEIPDLNKLDKRSRQRIDSFL